jgi:hypothetical protein
MEQKDVNAIIARIRIGLLTALSMVAITSCARLPEVQANDNRTPAGVLRGDTLVVRMVVQAARWHPEAPEGPYIDTEALGEDTSVPAHCCGSGQAVISDGAQRCAIPPSAARPLHPPRGR